MHTFFNRLSDEVQRNYLETFVNEKLYIGHKKIEIQVEEDVHQPFERDGITFATHISLHGKKKVDGKWISISEPLLKSQMDDTWANITTGQPNTPEQQVSAIENFAQQFMDGGIGSIDILEEHYYEITQLSSSNSSRQNSFIDLYYDASGNPTLKFLKGQVGRKENPIGEIWNDRIRTDLTAE